MESLIIMPVSKKINEMQKSVLITVCGASNAGKSTLINHIVKHKVSLVSPKLQSTRRRVMAVYMQKNTQLVFVDSPGFFEKPTKKSNLLEKRILHEAHDCLNNSDYYLLLIDSKKTKH